MNESDLTARFLKLWRSQYPMSVALRHTDAIASGHPDVSLTMWSQTVWLEMKHANPYCKSPGIQQRVMSRLASAGKAFYIIWQEQKEVRRTLLVLPKDFEDKNPVAACEEFNIAWLCAEIEQRFS